MHAHIHIISGGLGTAALACVWPLADRRAEWLCFGGGVYSRRRGSVHPAYGVTWRAVHSACDALRCAGNSLGDAGAAALAAVLRTMSQLTSLNLAGTTAHAPQRTHARTLGKVRASRRLDVAVLAAAAASAGA
jgi:hypothetical protein